VAGRSTRLALIAACTSRATESTLRFKSNCKVTLEEPVFDCDVISLTPAITPRWRSSGVETLVAMVDGLGARQVGVDRDDREIHLRQRRHRQHEERANAGQRQATRQQDGGDRAPDEG